ncbi:MAG: class I SAM-dependent methyltransferase [Planctomycetota bacterium]
MKQTNNQISKWPKKKIPLSLESQKIADDWMKYFHEIHKDKFSSIIKFSHEYVVKNSPQDFITTLEIGAGLGEHLNYEKLTENQHNNYVALELRENMAEVIKSRFPAVKTCIADCQQHIPYPDGYFDRIIATHVLEHLPNLPASLDEILRLLKKGIGRFFVVIPCEGGLGYFSGRWLTTKRIFEKRYNLPYEKFIKAEHVSTANEIITEIKKVFFIEHSSWYPLRIPSIHLNLCIGLTLKHLNSKNK